MTWVVATEDHEGWPDTDGPIHAYDLITRQVPHPLGGITCTVHRSQLWSTARGRRCQHCLEIVGEEGSQTDH
jgi:hypothetical protein